MTSAKRRPGELTPHQLNAEIYREKRDEGLAKSIQERGILTPLLVSWDNVIISGHRRWTIASELGFESVPVVLFGSRDALDIEEAVIESNRQRVKTNEQIGREYRELQRIMNERESRQGAERDGHGRFAQPSEKQLSDGDKPSRKAAEQVGVSQPTASKAAAVVMVIDGLEEEGEKIGADKLRKKLNKSVAGAYKSLAKASNGDTQKEGEAPTKQQPLKAGSYEISDAMTFAGYALEQLKRIELTDPRRTEALCLVADWIKNQRGIL